MSPFPLHSCCNTDRELPKINYDDLVGNLNLSSGCLLLVSSSSSLSLGSSERGTLGDLGGGTCNKHDGMLRGRKKTNTTVQTSNHSMFKKPFFSVHLFGSGRNYAYADRDCDDLRMM
jgi:hypothetical protein